MRWASRLGKAEPSLTLSESGQYDKQAVLCRPWGAINHRDKSAAYTSAGLQSAD
jgi:predicted ATPase